MYERKIEMMEGSRKPLLTDQATSCSSHKGSGSRSPSGERLNFSSQEMQEQNFSSRGRKDYSEGSLNDFGSSDEGKQNEVVPRELQKEINLSKRSMFFYLAGYVLGSTGNRIWFFGSPLFVFSLFPSSFFYVSMYNLVPNVACMFLIPVISKDLHKYSRIYFFSILLVVEATMVSLQGFILIFLIYTSGDKLPNGDLPLTTGRLTLLGFLFLGNTAGSICQYTRSLVLRRDWLPQLALAYPVEEERMKILTLLNTKSVRCMAFSEIIGPVIGGLILSTSLDMLIPCFLTTSLCLIMAVMEFSLEFQVYIYQMDFLGKPKDSSPKSTPYEMFLKMFSVISGCRILIRHQVCYVAIAMAVVYYNVLAPGNGILMSFLTAAGLSPSDLSIFRVIAAGIGMLGTVVFPPIEKRTGIHWATTIFIGLEVTALFLAYVFASHIGSSAKNFVGYAFLAFVILSRFGLYSFCIGVANLVQLGTEPSMVGPINAQEQSLINFMNVLMYLSGAIFAQYVEFPLLILFSLAICFFGFVLCFAFSWKFPGTEAFRHLDAQ